MPLNGTAIRREFPLLSGGQQVYLDNAATTQKPRAVLEAMENFYQTHNANVHRGMHALADQATALYEEARASVQSFIGAARKEEVIFTKNCTESINLVAKTWGRKNLRRGDVVVLSLLEHHSNIVPWLQLKEENGCDVRWIDIDDDGMLKMEMLDAYLAEGKVKLVSITALSNVLGVHTPLRVVADKAHAAGAKICVDAAQLVAHEAIDVQELDCNFLAFSGHKLYGPTGIGVLYGKRELLEEMSPFLGGGTMIREVTKDHFTAADLPHKFEAGTPPIAEAVGLAAAIRWLQTHPWMDIADHEHAILSHALEKLSQIEGMRILGPGHAHLISGCISFVVDGMHPHDLTEILGRSGISLRAGHHCAQPLHERLEVKATTRLSVGIYNTKEDIDTLARAMRECIDAFKRRH